MLDAMEVLMDALCVASRVSKSSVRKASTSTRATTSTKAAKATTSGARSKKSPGAGDVPATRAMLGAVRDELLERIDQSREEARSDFSRLDGKIDAVRAELKADIHELKAGQARMMFLLEEQNARNKIVLDAIAAFMDWRVQVDQRLDDVEKTVRSLAAARPVREPA